MRQDYLKQFLHYDPVTGSFNWRTSGKGRRKDLVAGCKNGKGYVCIRIDGQIYLAHRLAWIYVHGAIPEGKLIDHRNGVCSDNRICNLRVASHSQNNENKRRPKKKSASGLLGVSLKKSTGKWESRIKVGSRNINLGVFDDPKSAHEAYILAKRRLHAFCTI